MAGRATCARDWRWAKALGIGILLWALMGSRQAGADPPPIGEQTEPDPREPAREVAGADETATWHLSLVRDRSLEQRLDLARREIAQGRFHEPLAAIQQILDAQADTFLQGTSNQPPQGARRHAEQLLQSLPAPARKLYVTLYDAQAAQLLADPGSGNTLSSREQVVRRFFQTPTGARACRELAEAWTDRGQWSRAAACWKRLLDDPLHSQMLTSTHRLRAALCARMAGQIREIAAPIAGQESFTTERLNDLALHFQTTARQGAVPENGTPPLLAYPQWRVSLAGPASGHLVPIFANWELQQVSRAQPVASANFGIRAGGLLVFRDFEGVRAIDPATQRVAWQYRSESGLHRVSPAPRDATEPTAEISTLVRLWNGNRLQGLLSTDGRLVFALDEVEWRWQTGQTEADALAVNRQTNRLIALESCGPSAGTPRWSAGGPAGGRDASKSLLAGHFFFGPPLALEGRLYTITESNQEIFLTCLDGGTGAVCWTQSLCAVPLAISQDAPRYYLGCMPVAADGLILCPTQSGVLIAADAQTGSLEWACSYDDAEQLERIAAWPNGNRTRYEHGAFPNAPLVAREASSGQSRVVYLPPHSERLHCLDLVTGRTLWTVRREDGEPSVEHVACADTQTVMLVSRRRCRGLSLATGREQWTCPLTSGPSGRGVRQGSRYLVPLAEGRIVCVDVATGREHGFTQAQATLRPGNLLAFDDLLVSLGSTEIAAFPQTGAWLQRLAQGSPAPASVDSRLLSSELKLAVGDAAAARADLQALLARGTTSQTADATAKLAESLLREVLRTPPIAGAPDDSHAGALEQLAELSRRPEDRARLLIHRVRRHVERGELATALDKLADLVDLPCDQPVPLDGEPTRSIATECWARGTLAQLLRDADPDGAAQIRDFLDSRLHHAIALGDRPVIRRWIRAGADFPAAEFARLHLAQRLMQAGEVHEPEMLLLGNLHAIDRPTRAAAAKTLAELLTARGLPQDAARLLRELRDEYGDVPVTPGLSGRDYVAQLSPTDLSVLALHRFSPPGWLTSSSSEDLAARLRIHENRWFNAALHQAYNPVQAKLRSTPRGFAFQLFDREPSASGEFVLLDRLHGGVLPGEIVVPRRYNYPTSPEQSFVGRMVPLGSQGTAHGVSLLEQKVVWNTSPRGLHPVNDAIKVGPAGPAFALFQCWHHLFVLDPADGHVLWHRNDVAGNSGLMADAQAGVLADERVVVVFDYDRCGYTVFDGPTGSELRRGRLNVDLRLASFRRVYGRRLFYCTRSGENRMVRIWDPASDSAVWEEPLDRLRDVSPQAGFRPGSKLCAFVQDAHELAYITTDGRLHVIDALTGKSRLDAAIDQEDLDQVGALRVFGDDRRYYVNLQRWPLSTSGQNAFIANDTHLPAAHFQGDVAAFDRGTGQLLWQRDLGQRTILQLAEYRLPFLVSMHRCRNGSQLSLSVEVIDAATGAPLAARNDLLAEQILQLSYRRDPTQLVLRGVRTEVFIDVRPSNDRPVQTAAEDSRRTR